jgi:hypothetical protein
LAESDDGSSFIHLSSFLEVLKVLRVLEGNKARKINAIEDEKPPFMG